MMSYIVGRIRLNAPKIIQKTEFFLSTSIFHNRKLSFLESIIVYLKEIHMLEYAEISRLTNRDRRNVFSVYKKACDKLGDTEFTVSHPDSFFYIPLTVIQDRSLSIMEVVVEYLSSIGLKNSEIAKLLTRSPKTVFTVHARVNAKRMKKK